ncbi:MAG: polysaccharide deacetylase family protein [Pyrinomonadaceae bacterium]
MFNRKDALRLASKLAAAPYVVKRVDAWNGRRGGIILVFHEISEARLRRHLTLLAGLYRFVSLSEFARRLRERKSTAGLAAITFDDGYGHVVETAAQLARKHGWPVTFYLPTRYLDTREPNWYQELKPLFERATCNEVEIDGLRLSLRDADGRAAGLKQLDDRFRQLTSPEEIDNLLGRTRRALSASAECPADLSLAAPVSWPRVRELAAREELSFEAHSVNHFALSRLPAATVRAEMEQCRARIEEATGRRVEHFCYPFGGPAEIGTESAGIARELFSSATTMIRGRCRAGVDAAMLPRIPLYEQDTEETVSLKVSLAR